MGMRIFIVLLLFAVGKPFFIFRPVLKPNEATIHITKNQIESKLIKLQWMHGEGEGELITALTHIPDT